MPDLTIEIMQQCSDLDCHTVKIGDYQLTFDPHLSHPNAKSLWHCECKGFKYRGICKHVRQAEQEQCSWHQNYGIAQTDRQNKDKICPECGKPTMLVRVAV